MTLIVACRLKLTLQRMLSTSMGTAFLRSSLQRCILPWTSQKGMLHEDSCATLFIIWVHVMFTRYVMQLYLHRYICSSGEKESKSVISLFDDHLNNWVCLQIISFFSICPSMDCALWLKSLCFPIYNLSEMQRDGLDILRWLKFFPLFPPSLLPLLFFLIKNLPFQGKRNPGVPKPRLFTVGRLDVATTGLIIVTNDGM